MVILVHGAGGYEGERADVHGFSAGARLAAVALTTPDDPTFVGPELWAGESDGIDGAVLFYGYYDGMVFEEEAYFGGEAIPTAAIPIEKSASAIGPALIVHGEGDWLVPDRQSVELAEQLAADGVDVDLIVVADEPSHAFDGYLTDQLTPAGEALVPVVEDQVTPPATTPPAMTAAA